MNQLLSNWLEDEASSLILKDKITSATNDWLNNNKSSDWLVHKGNRLADAVNLISNELYIDDISTEIKEYLKECEQNQPDEELMEYKANLDLVKSKMGQDIIDRLIKNDELSKKEGPGAGLGDWQYAASEDEIQFLKNQFEDVPMWHPEPAIHLGNGGARLDYTEIWEFQCCKKRVYTESEPYQDRADGCQPKNN